MLVAATFKGTHQEGLLLLAAVERNCTCKKMLGMTQGPVCVPHAMLLGDQRALDGLLDGRRRATELWREEQCLPREVE